MLAIELQRRRMLVEDFSRGERRKIARRALSPRGTGRKEGDLVEMARSRGSHDLHSKIASCTDLGIDSTDGCGLHWLTCDLVQCAVDETCRSSVEALQEPGERGSRLVDVLRVKMLLHMR